MNRNHHVEILALRHGISERVDDSRLGSDTIGQRMGTSADGVLKRLQAQGKFGAAFRKAWKCCHGFGGSMPQKCKTNPLSISTYVLAVHPAPVDETTPTCAEFVVGELPHLSSEQCPPLIKPHEHLSYHVYSDFVPLSGRAFSVVSWHQH